MIARLLIPAFLAIASISAQTPDISVAGFRIGMTPEQVRATVKPGYREVVHQFPVKELSGFADLKASGRQLQDIFFFTFWDGKLIGVSRFIHYQPSDAPLRSQMIQDLKAKYGNPVNQPDPMHFEWRFKDGKPVPLQKVNYTMGPSCVTPVRPIQLPTDPLYFGILDDGKAGFIQPVSIDAVSHKMYFSTDFCSNLDHITATVAADGNFVGVFNITLANETAVRDFAMKLQQSEKQNADAQEKAREDQARKKHDQPF